MFHEFVASLLLLFFLPGYFLINALFPHKGELDRDYDIVYRLILGIVLSVALTIVFGFGVSSLGPDPVTGRGYYTAGTLWLGLGLLAVGLFAAGWWRGAYPIVGKLHPSLIRLPKPLPQSILAETKLDRDFMVKLRELATRRDRLRREQSRLAKRVEILDGEERTRYEARRKEVEGELRRVNAELKALEEKRAAELY